MSASTLRLARAVARLTVLGATTTLASCTILGMGVSVDEKRPLDPGAAIVVTDFGAGLRGRDREDVIRSTTVVHEPIVIDTATTRDVAAAAMPAVVSIFTETEQPVRVSLFPLPLPGTYFHVPIPGEALGSGFFVHPDGFLLTNAHVVARAASIQAKTQSGVTYELEVVARDPALDLALLRAVVDGEVPHLQLVDGAAAAVGDRVIAIGNPLGLGHTVTEGIISQNGRQIPELAALPGRQVEFLQTDATVNPGSSGGPLLNFHGEVVGINTAMAADAQGIAFTVPSHQVIEFIEAVLAGQSVPGPAFEPTPRIHPRRPLGE